MNLAVRLLVFGGNLPAQFQGYLQLRAGLLFEANYYRTYNCRG